VIRVAVVDDHPAVRLGLESALGGEPGLVAVGSATGPEEVAPLLYRTRPDVVLLDYHLPRRDGLAMCQEIKGQLPAPAVVLYSAYADAALVIPAIVAGADGIVHKSASPRQLFDALRTVAKGRTVLPPVSADLLELAAAALDPDDRPILAMLVSGRPRRTVASALRMSPEALGSRIAAMLDRLKTPVTAGRPASARTS
jgi:DNA-binding NarL/FixJ family response regulator